MSLLTRVGVFLLLGVATVYAQYQSGSKGGAPPSYISQHQVGDGLSPPPKRTYGASPTTSGVRYAGVKPSRRPYVDPLQAPITTRRPQPDLPEELLNLDFVFAGPGDSGEVQGTNGGYSRPKAYSGPKAKSYGGNGKSYGGNGKSYGGNGYGAGKQRKPSKPGKSYASTLYSVPGETGISKARVNSAVYGGSPIATTEAPSSILDSFELNSGEFDEDAFARLGVALGAIQRDGDASDAATGGTGYDTGYSGYTGSEADGQVIQAAIQSKHSLKFKDVPSSRGQLGRPITVEVGPNPIAELQLKFRSASSPLKIDQEHERGGGSLQETQSEDEPHVLRHTVKRPVVQEIHEVIQPFRKIKQHIEPVQEEIETVVSRGTGTKQTAASYGAQGTSGQNYGGQTYGGGKPSRQPTDKSYGGQPSQSYSETPVGGGISLEEFGDDEDLGFVSSAELDLNNELDSDFGGEGGAQLLGGSVPRRPAQRGSILGGSIPQYSPGKSTKKINYGAGNGNGGDRKKPKNNNNNGFSYNIATPLTSPASYATGRSANGYNGYANSRGNSVPSTNNYAATRGSTIGGSVPYTSYSFSMGPTSTTARPRSTNNNGESYSTGAALRANPALQAIIDDELDNGEINVGTELDLLSSATLSPKLRTKLRAPSSYRPTPFVTQQRLTAFKRKAKAKAKAA